MNINSGTVRVTAGGAGGNGRITANVNTTLILGDLPVGTPVTLVNATLAASGAGPPSLAISRSRPARPPR